MPNQGFMNKKEGIKTKKRNKRFAKLERRFIFGATPKTVVFSLRSIESVCLTDTGEGARHNSNAVLGWRRAVFLVEKKVCHVKF